MVPLDVCMDAQRNSRYTPSLPSHNKVQQHARNTDPTWLLPRNINLSVSYIETLQFISVNILGLMGLLARVWSNCRVGCHISENHCVPFLRDGSEDIFRVRGDVTSYSYGWFQLRLQDYYIYHIFRPTCKVQGEGQWKRNGERQWSTKKCILREVGVEKSTLKLHNFRGSRNVCSIIISHFMLSWWFRVYDDSVSQYW